MDAVDITIRAKEFEDPAQARDADVRLETSPDRDEWDNVACLGISIQAQNDLPGEYLAVAMDLVAMKAHRDAVDAAIAHMEAQAG